MTFPFYTWFLHQQPHYRAYTICGWFDRKKCWRVICYVLGSHLIIIKNIQRIIIIRILKQSSVREQRDQEGGPQRVVSWGSCVRGEWMEHVSRETPGGSRCKNTPEAQALFWCTNLENNGVENKGLTICCKEISNEVNSFILLLVPIKAKVEKRARISKNILNKHTKYTLTF